MDLLIFFLVYFFIITSVIGYGLFFSQLVKSETITKSFGYSGLTGLFFLTIYSYISNIFFAHSELHNIFLLFIGLIFFCYVLLRKKKHFNKKKFIIPFFVISIFFISFLVFKTHDDFPYYHFAYSYYLTQNSLFIGIGPFNHGFRTPSSIFYMNSLFYLPFIKHYMFHISAAMIMIFANLILIEKIFNNIKYKQITFLTFFSLLSFLFINIFFYRLGEHGTDRSAQILILILLIEILFLTNFSKNIQNDINKIFVIIGLVISLKAFYILYLLLLIPVIYFIIKIKKFHYLFSLYKNKIFIFLFSIVSLILLTNFFNTGCVVYPVASTCFENIIWSFDTELVNKMNDWYEQWSKAGAGPNFRVENPEIYITHFNWVSNWLDNYFFNKVSDFLIGLFLMSIIVFFSFFSTIKKKVTKRKIILLYFLILILFLEWFYNHPALRYGGFCIIAALIFIPLSKTLENSFNYKDKNYVKKFYILMIIGLIIFFGRNIDRIENENDLYGYNPFKSPYYSFNQKFYLIQNTFNSLVNNYESCIQKENECISDLKPTVVKKYNKYIFFNNQ